MEESTFCFYLSTQVHSIWERNYIPKTYEAYVLSKLRALPGKGKETSKII
jgi:hypothetical protein